MIYDLSPTIHADLPVWPGDTRYEARLTWSMAEGGTVNVTAITHDASLGSHADAPFHTEPRGEGISDLPLERYLGPCRVVKVPPAAAHRAAAPGGDRPFQPATTAPQDGERARPPDVPGTLSPRFRRSWPSSSAKRRSSSSGSTPRRSTPSTARPSTPTTPSPAAACPTRRLVLDGVPEGIYELIALPLKLAGLDASPVRAVLRTLDS